MTYVRTSDRKCKSDATEAFDRLIAAMGMTGQAEGYELMPKVLLVYENRRYLMRKVVVWPDDEHISFITWLIPAPLKAVDFIAAVEGILAALKWQMMRKDFGDE